MNMDFWVCTRNHQFCPLLSQIQEVAIEPRLAVNSKVSAQALEKRNNRTSVVREINQRSTPRRL